VNQSTLQEIKKDPGKIELLDQLFLTTFPASMRRLGMINDQQQCANLPDDLLMSIHVPTLVIHAIDDPIVPFEFGEYSAKKIPDAEFEIIPEGGHFCTITHQEIVIPRIRKFLAENSH
jgi:pimeloyl-ACP methyl ester carboxylesterase